MLLQNSCCTKSPLALAPLQTWDTKSSLSCCPLFTSLYPIQHDGEFPRLASLEALCSNYQTHAEAIVNCCLFTTPALPTLACGPLKIPPEFANILTETQAYKQDSVAVGKGVLCESQTLEAAALLNPTQSCGVLA